MNILAKIKDFVNLHFNDIILAVIVCLLTLFSFAAGYIAAKYTEKQPIIIQNQK